VLAFEALSQFGGQPAQAAGQLVKSPGAPAVFHTAANAQATRKPTCLAE